MECYKIINEFLQNHHLGEENKQVLGVIFYGSSKYQTNQEGSDIDLLIVTNASKCLKGVTYIQGIKIEYFEKPFDYLLKQIEEIPYSFDHSLLSIFQNGEILFSKDYALEYLKDEVLSQNKMKKKTKKVNHTLYNEWLEFFYQLPKNSVLFSYIYHNLLEIIRKLYHEESGFSKLPSMKVDKLYQDKNYASSYYCVHLPNNEFRELYLELMESEYKEENLQKLLNYIPDNDDFSLTTPNFYQLNELKYKSTIAETCVSKTIALINEEHPASSHYYYITLEKLRVLYCNINGIDETITQFGHSYDAEFLSLFQVCLSKMDIDSLKKLFYFISSPLKMDYKNYKVIEYHI